MRFVKIGVITLVSFIAIAGLPAAASAQGNSNNSGNPAILKALETLQQTVNGLVTSAAPGHVLFTPVAVVHDDGTPFCLVNNVVDASREVNIAIVDASTAVQLISLTVTLAPGKYAATSYPSLDDHIVFCRISVNNGGKDDVRGVLYTVNTPTAGWHNPLAAR